MQYFLGSTTLVIYLTLPGVGKATSAGPESLQLVKPDRPGVISQTSQNLGNRKVPVSQGKSAGNKKKKKGRLRRQPPAAAQVPPPRQRGALRPTVAKISRYPTPEPFPEALVERLGMVLATQPDKDLSELAYFFARIADPTREHAELKPSHLDLSNQSSAARPASQPRSAILQNPFELGIHALRVSKETETSDFPRYISEHFADIDGRYAEVLGALDGQEQLEKFLGSELNAEEIRAIQSWMLEHARLRDKVTFIHKTIKEMVHVSQEDRSQIGQLTFAMGWTSRPDHYTNQMFKSYQPDFLPSPLRKAAGIRAVQKPGYDPDGWFGNAAAIRALIMEYTDDLPGFASNLGTNLIGNSARGIFKSARISSVISGVSDVVILNWCRVLMLEERLPELARSRDQLFKQVEVLKRSKLAQEMAMTEDDGEAIMITVFDALKEAALRQREINAAAVADLLVGEEAAELERRKVILARLAAEKALREKEKEEAKWVAKRKAPPAAAAEGRPPNLASDTHDERTAIEVVVTEDDLHDFELVSYAQKLQGGCYLPIGRALDAKDTQHRDDDVVFDYGICQITRKMTVTEDSNPVAEQGSWTLPFPKYPKGVRLSKLQLHAMLARIYKDDPFHAGLLHLVEPALNHGKYVLVPKKRADGSQDDYYLSYRLPVTMTLESSDPGLEPSRVIDVQVQIGFGLIERGDNRAPQIAVFHTFADPRQHAG